MTSDSCCDPVLVRIAGTEATDGGTILATLTSCASTRTSVPIKVMRVLSSVYPKAVSSAGGTALVGDVTTAGDVFTGTSRGGDGFEETFGVSTGGTALEDMTTAGDVFTGTSGRTATIVGDGFKEAFGVGTGDGFKEAFGVSTGDGFKEALDTTIGTTT